MSPSNDASNASSLPSRLVRFLSSAVACCSPLMNVRALVSIHLAIWPTSGYSSRRGLSGFLEHTCAAVGSEAGSTTMSTAKLSYLGMIDRTRAHDSRSFALTMDAAMQRAATPTYGRGLQCRYVVNRLAGKGGCRGTAIGGGRPSMMQKGRSVAGIPWSKWELSTDSKAILPFFLSAFLSAAPR